MDTFVETIRTAVRGGATADQKQAGTVACRAILAALEGQVGHALSALPPVPPRLEVDQVLDLVIARLRTMVPTEPGAAPARLSFPMVTAPRSAS
jgi:hypothetical protein